MSREMGMELINCHVDTKLGRWYERESQSQILLYDEVFTMFLVIFQEKMKYSHCRYVPGNSSLLVNIVLEKKMLKVGKLQREVCYP